MSDGPQQGEIWAYPYLWARQAGRGETEGRKNRPCAVAVLVRREDGQAGVVFLAITTQRPGADRQALEIPETERRRAGLAEDMPLWIILDEHNRDVIETSYYLEPGAYIGAFGQKFFMQLQRALLEAIRQRKSAPVRRRET